MTAPGARTVANCLRRAETAWQRAFCWLVAALVMAGGLGARPAHALIAARLPGDAKHFAAAVLTQTPGMSQGPAGPTLIPVRGDRRQGGALRRASSSLTQNFSPDSEPLATPTPVYQAWYFYLALLFIGITLPAHLFRRHMLLMKGRLGIVLEERNRIASECHDTLMAGFAAISWQLEATAKIFRDSGLDSTAAAESCELARSMVAHCQAEARRIIWDLRETDEITSILSQALARSLAANQVRSAIETTLEVEGEEIPLAPGCVHHLVCIGQEAVTNAIRHAHPTQILVQVKYEGDALQLSVRDNGRGVHAPPRAVSRHGHFGIAVMEERARKIGGVFRMQSLPGHGTEVTVRVGFSAVQQPLGSGQHSIRWIGI